MKGILQNLYTLQGLDSGGQKHDSSQIALLRQGIPAGMLAHYDRVRARGKKGIALLRNSVCTNCRMQVPVAVTASLKAGSVQTCGNCGIYLCLPDWEVAETAAPPAASVTAKPKRRKRQVAVA